MTNTSKSQGDGQKLERPDVVTFRWLFDNVPVKIWSAAIVLLFTVASTTFYFGQEWSDVDTEESKDTLSLFARGYPYPHPLRGFPIGTMPLVLMSAFPDVEYHVAPFIIPFTDGPFELAEYELGPDSVNPTIESVRFIIKRNPDGQTSRESSTEVWRQVMEAFKSYSFEESELEKAIFWANVHGQQLTLTESYFRVEKSPEWRPLPGGQRN